MLTYLEKRLSILRIIPPEETTVRFELDPLEEYLAALHALELGGSSEEEWRKFLQMADQMPGAPEQIKGFLSALHDCCEAKGSQYGIPNCIVDEVGKRAGLDPEITLRQRVKVLGLAVKKGYDGLELAIASDELAQIGPTAIRTLVSALNDSDPDVREGAAEALREIGPTATDAFPAVIASLRDTDASVRICSALALGCFGPRAKDAVPGLIVTLSDGDAGVRKSAAFALARIGPAAKDAVAALTLALADTEAVVRKCAGFALEAITMAGPQEHGAVSEDDPIQPLDVS
jgi:hypothetical protein